MFTAIGAAIRRARQRKERGQTAIIFAGGLFVFIGIVGLAIDAGRGYVVSAQLSKAVDAAVLAGAKASGSREAVESVIERTMKINFPQDYMGCQGGHKSLQLTIDRIDDPVTGHTAKRISYKAEAVLPATFLQVLGVPDMYIHKQATSLRLVLDIIIVADRSSSIGPVPFQTFKRDIKNFLDIFDPLEDRVAMLTYAGSLTWVAPLRSGAPGFDKSQIRTAIDQAEMEGFTASGPAMYAAYKAFQGTPDVPGQENRWKVILFFTDGTPNVIQVNPSHWNFGPCTDRRQTWCGVAPNPGGCTNTLGDTFTGTGVQGVQIMAGEMDHPFPYARHYLFALFRNISRLERGQEYDVYDDRGFLRESPQTAYPSDWGTPTGSLVDTREPLVGVRGAECADPRYIFGFGVQANPGHQPDLRYLDGRPQRPSGQEIPNTDVYGVPLTDQTRNGYLVSARKLNDIKVPVGNQPARWMTLRKKINAAARNHLENVADLIREPVPGRRGFEKGITIFAIGLDGQYRQMSTPNDEFNGERGRDICQRVANVPEAGSYYNPTQPEGLFVQADDAGQLADAFRKVAATILRLLY